MPTILAVTSDLHINSTLGLSLPRIELDDGGEYRPSRTQRWLYDCWCDFWDEVEKCKQNARLLTLFNGDISDLDAKNRTHQIISRNKAQALRHVAELIDRPVRMSDWAVFVRGTHSHTGKGSWTEEEVARDTDNAVPAHDGLSSWATWYANLGGLVVDARHFVRLGTKTRTLLNPLGDLSEEVELFYRRANKPVPKLIIRSHRHTWADTADNHPARVVVTGSFQGEPEYLNGNIQPPGIGGIIIEVQDDSTWTLKKVRYAPAPPKIWTLPKMTG